MSELITCPSGLSGMITGLKGKTLRLLSDRAAQRSGTLVDKVLAEAWESIVDPGPYAFTGKPDWSKVLLGDYMYTMIQVRMKTFGASFTFKLQCTNTACRQRFEHEIDLAELPVKTMSDEDKAAFAGGNRILGTLPDGRQFTFRLMTSGDIARLRKASGSVDWIGVMKGRILEIEGLDEREKSRYFDEADLPVAYDTLTEMDRHDCGIETKFEVECPDCREAMDFEIPLEGLLNRPSPTKT